MGDRESFRCRASPARLLLPAVLAGALTGVSLMQSVKAEIVFEGLPPLDGVKGAESVVGPVPGMRGVSGPGEGITLTDTMAEPIGRRGSVSFWVRPKRTYRNGLVNEYNFWHPMLEIGELLYLRQGVSERYLALDLLWDDAAAGTRKMHRLGAGFMTLPDHWHHVAIWWDAEKGLLEGTLDGAPLREPGITVDSWETSPVDELRLNVRYFEFAGVEVRNEPLDYATVRGQLPESVRGAMDRQLGNFEAKTLPSERIASLKGEKLYDRTLSDAGDVSRWVMEGPAAIQEFRDGWMELSSTQPDDKDGHFTYWCDKVFPASFVAEWEVRLLGPHGMLMTFFSATGREGKDLFDPSLAERTGVYSQYRDGDINAYHISYFSNNPHNPGRITSNMRKSHGFYMTDNGPPGIRSGSGEVHQVTLIKEGPRIRLLVDNRVIIDFEDDGERYGEVYGEGRIGFRQMEKTKARYRNFRVYRLNSE